MKTMASQGFTERVLGTGAVYLNDAAAYDLDGDGDQDIVATSGSTDSVVWYENDGDETFTEHPIVASPSYTASVRIFVADVDGDGDGDILAHTNQYILFYANDGNANFTEMLISDQASNAQATIAADLDGDGDLDVVTASTDSHTISWHELALNLAPSAVSLLGTTTSLPESTDTTAAFKVADIVITDDGLGTNTITRTGADKDSFEVIGESLYLKAGTALDYEAKTSYAVTVNVEDSSVSGSTPVTVDFVLSITDVNEAPVLDDANMSVAENSAEGTVVGTLAATDDDGTEATIAPSGMFWVDGSIVYRADRDGSNLTQIHDGSDGYIGWIEADWQNEHLYLRGEGGVWRMDFAGSNLTNIVPGLHNGFGIALDVANNTIYYGDHSGTGIYRCDLDGSNIQLLPDTSNGFDMLRHVNDIEVAASIGKVYYTNNEHAQFSRFNGIRRANLDGSGVEDIFSAQPEEGILLLAIDETNNHLYYSDEKDGTITRASLDGSNASVIVSGVTQIYDLEVDPEEGKLYYSSSALLGRANLDGTGQETLATLGGGRFDKGLALSYTSIPAISYSITSNVNPDGDEQRCLPNRGR